MNKVALIAGGCSLAGIAVGAAGGYFVARRQFDATLTDIVTDEIDKVKKNYALRLMEVKDGKPENPVDLVTSLIDGDPDYILDEDERLPIEGDLPETPTDIVEEATTALTDYRGIGKRVMEEKVPLSELGQQRNIFTDNASTITANTTKKSLPPRGPGGKFQPKKQQSVPDQRAPEDPYMITHDEFLENDPDHEQETLVYFVKDHTLLVKADYQESVDIERVGEVNLTLFPDTDGNLVRSIAVRNEKHHIDYDVELNEGSLTEAMGLGESDDDVDDADLPADAYL